MAFLKKASLKIENPEVSVDSWIGNRGSIKTATNKVIEYKKIISDFNPEDYLLTHCTIVASVNTEDAPKAIHFGSDKSKKEFPEIANKRNFYITPETSKYMNANGDAWARDLLKSSYKSFIGAENYLEHVQDPTLSKGKILDAVIREVDEGKSLFVDILVATNKKHSDLVEKIKTGKLSTLSMGAVVSFTVCTKCGRVASDETELCNDIKFFKRNTFICETDGKKRVTAELCGDVLYPDSNKFIEGSWVETPAFKGAVMRSEIEVAALDKEAFVEKYEPIMSIKSADLRETASRVMAAFSLVDKIKGAFGKKSKTEDPDVLFDDTEDEEKSDEPVKEKFDNVPMKDPQLPEGEDAPIDPPSLDDEEKPAEAPVKKEEDSLSEETPTEKPSLEEPAKEEPPKEDAPVEEPPKEDAPVPPAEEPVTEDVPKEELTKDAPDKDPTEEPDLGDTSTEPLPEEVGDMTEENKDIPPSEEEAPVDPELEEQAKKPYNVLKEEIKKTLKEQIKKELLRDLGIDMGNAMDVGLSDVNLNDSIIKSHVIKKASEIVKKSGFKSLYQEGFDKTSVLKIAMLSGRYSINKDVFKVIDTLNIKDFPTFRRIAKTIETKLGIQLSVVERLELNRLITDIF